FAVLVMCSVATEFFSPALHAALPISETTAELAEIVEAYRPELASTAAARETTRFLLLQPPVPWVARAPYTLLACAAVGLLPEWRSEEHTSELQSRFDLVCRLLLEKKK